MPMLTPDTFYANFMLTDSRNALLNYKTILKKRQKITLKNDNFFLGH
jgi:hypothetical protein